MYNCTQMVANMCVAFEHPVSLTPNVPDETQQRLRRRLCVEEIGETITKGFEKKDLVEIADGLADTVVVVVGSHLAYGLPVFEPIWMPPHFAPQMPTPEESSWLVKMLEDSQEGIEEAFAYLDENGVPPDLNMISAALDRAMSMVNIVTYRCGIDFMPVFKEVHRSNMSKVMPNGKVKKDEGGKVIKPEGYSPPDIAAELERQKKLFNR